MREDDTTNMRLGAAAVAVAPAVLLAGFLAHPFIPTLPDAAAVAAAVEENSTRWGLAHVTVAVASGLLILAFSAIRTYLRQVAEERWSARGLPFIVMGSTLFALLPGMEFAPLAVAESGGDAQAAQAALESWFVPILVLGAACFAIGAICFAVAVVVAGVLGRRAAWLVAGALVVMALARIVPNGVMQFYVQGVAGAVALWPLANLMWQHARARSVQQPQPVATT